MLAAWAALVTPTRTAAARNMASMFFRIAFMFILLELTILVQVVAVSERLGMMSL
jgi:hypothetical protein